MLRMEDRLLSAPQFVAAACGAIEAYLRLHAQPSAAQKVPQGAFYFRLFCENGRRHACPPPVHKFPPTCSSTACMLVNPDAGPFVL